MAVDFSTLSGATSSVSGNGTAPSSSADGTATADRFLKLLVTQMQNQDPLNPMDNAQVTSQMAQINTVNGIDKLNTTVGSLNAQFVQLQSLQAAGLVDRDVWVQGNSLQVENGTGIGAFNLSGPADSVKVDVLNGAGSVVGTVNLGAQGAGRQDFRWTAGAYASDPSLSFRVTALSGTKPVDATLLSRDHVDTVGVNGDSLTVSLTRLGDVPYTKVLAID